MSDIPRRINADGHDVVDTSDAAWVAYVAEGRDQLTRAKAAHAETRHQLELAKMEGLNAINTTQYDPAVLDGARKLHAQNPAGPTVPELIEKVIIPIREKFVAEFSSAPAPAPTRAGENESVFLKLIGKSNG